MTRWTFYVLFNGRNEVVGWQRVNGTRAEYIGLLDERWHTLPLPWADRVRLDELPAGFDYLEGAHE